ncbi:MAG: serine/threonine-protein kinase [Myxococcota bacterium]
MNDLLLNPGDRIGDYIVEGELGRGSCALVFRVRHRIHGTAHAMKLLVWNNASLRARLAREGAVQSQINHPNVVPVQEVITFADQLLLVAELIEGPTLEEWLTRHRPGFAEAEALFRQILAGLAAAHAHGVIHRDLKPSNVLLQRDGNGELIARITDFGIARYMDMDATLTRPGSPVGTPGYMAPEQFDDATTVDERADVFSAGCVLYELLTNRALFRGNMAAMELATRAGEFHLPAGIPQNLARALRGCLAISVDQRLRNCAALCQVLDGREPPDVMPVPQPKKARYSGVGARLVLAMGATLSVLLLLGAVLS